MSDNPTKKLRSQPPDVTVAVGEGGALQEFECYKVVLSIASPYFDAMFSAGMRENETHRIEYPDKDPEEWKIFYQFLGHEIDIKEYAKILSPSFHEFQMNRHLEKCDGILADKVTFLTRKKRDDDDAEIKYDASFWDRVGVNAESGRTKKPMLVLKERKEAFEEIIELLQLSCMYGLVRTKEAVEDFIFVAADALLFQTYDLFDLPAVTALTELFLPLEKEADGIIVPKGKSAAFWRALDYDFCQRQLCTLSIDSINQNEMLPLLLKVQMERAASLAKMENWYDQIEAVAVMARATQNEVLGLAARVRRSARGISAARPRP